jgi:hypothetical protein
MMRAFVRLSSILALPGLLACATQRTPTYCASLAGAGPASDALDPAATGFAVLRVESPTAIRFLVRTSGLGTVVATHIHRGEACTNGPMAHEINPGFTSESIRGIAANLPPELVADIEARPSSYYVKLHSLKYPGGAIRGQLAKCRSKELR